MRRPSGLSLFVPSLLLTAATCFGLGVVGAPYLVKEGARLTGRLDVVAFRPLISEGCSTESDRVLALGRHLQEGQTVLARLLGPRPAEAQAAGRACRVTDARWRLRNLIVNAGETELRDCFNNDTGTACTDSVKTWKYHGIGTGATGAAEADTGCQTELTTQYNPDSTRATGTQGTNGANVYRTVGTNTVDATVAATEWCLLNAATGAGTPMWSRVVYSTINLASGDSLQTTYDLTIE